MPRSSHLLRVLALAWLLIGWSTVVCGRAAAQAEAEAGALVAVVDAPRDDELVANASRRVAAELSAEGFTVRTSPRPSDVSDRRRVLEHAAARHGAAAAILVYPTSSGMAADIWGTDRVAQVIVVRTVTVVGGDAEQARTLALSAVEQLRADMLEPSERPTIAPPSLPTPSPPAPTPAPTPTTSAAPPSSPAPASPPGPPTPPEPAPPAPASAPHFVPDASAQPATPGPTPSVWSGLSLQLSVGLLASFDGLGVAVPPVLRLGYGSDDGLVGRLTIAGPGFGASGDGPAGSADVRQELAGLGAAYAASWEAWTALVGGGLGAYHLHAEGDLVPPFVGGSADVWALAIDAGGGVGYVVSDDLLLLLDAALIVTVPRPVVRMYGTPVGSSGQPSLLASFGLVVLP